MSKLQGVPLCVDGRMLGPGGTGVASYARALASAQARLSAAHGTLEDCTTIGADAFGGRPLRWAKALFGSTVRVCGEGPGRIFAADIFRRAQVHFDMRDRLLTLIHDGPAGIMHWSYPLPIRLEGWTNVYTVHDAIPLLHPELSPIDARRHARMLRRILDAGGLPVTVSDAAREEIAAALQLPPAHIVNCSQAIHTPEIGALPTGLEPDDYLLVVGSVERRKNMSMILEAFAESRVALPLVIAGPARAGEARLEARLAEEPGVIRLPYVSSSSLGALMAGAKALMMPSLAEGFGLPVAEAMSLGTPVITSRAGALAETAGGAALLVDPDSSASIASAIRRIVADEAECRRLSALGLANAQRFTPERFAERLGSFYASLIAESWTGR